MKLYFNMDGKPMSFEDVRKILIDNGDGSVSVWWGDNKYFLAEGITIDALNGAWPKENKDDRSL